ncbi:MAG: 3-oxoacyl-[acyl-carrier-protein] reductase [Candidatus Firestonebacteria bacterium]|nr:3-oxoacyl-[acyl-carrier-protein] reductase [Candidatus Firestonebacteria bacterium]
MLEGKVAFVTGGARGIGRITAIALAKEGADIIVVNTNEDLLQKVVEEIQALGRKAMGLKVNVTNSQEVDTAVKKVLDTFGKIDILVNNAGITRDNLIIRMKEEDWDSVLHVNLKGVFLCTKAVLRSMMKRESGKIINIASVVGISGNIGQANYSAAKAGIIGLTKTTAREVASRGITVNAVAPGFIDTDMTRALPAYIKENITRQIPLNRFGKPEDVAGVIVFLASERADYITGEVIRVDGGMIM